MKATIIGIEKKQSHTRTQGSNGNRVQYSASMCTFGERARHKFEDFVEYDDREGHLEYSEPLGEVERRELEDGLRSHQVGRTVHREYE